MQFASVNDVVIHYDFQRAAAEKPVLVFINSLGTDLRIWDEVRLRLGNDVSVLVYDKRGHGLSDIGNTPYTIELLAADLTALLDKLSIKRAIICGLSVGGLIAQGVVAARPDLVTGLVLSNTAHKIGTADMWDARIAAIRENGLASILDATMPRWFTPAYRHPDNPSYRAYCNMFVRQPLEGYAATCAALRDADLTQVAKRFRCRHCVWSASRTVLHRPPLRANWQASFLKQILQRLPTAAISPASNSPMPTSRCYATLLQTDSSMENNHG
ncbi:3-oxoadipate enol-lactonase [Ochrobactrum intermedium]|uniref:3-oxoadipate enol-lactonase n=1 Tax=Brucella ciceri TaxID=391287 RepID=A0ABX1DW09_9HYPH|nr:3-oxoadipate enol-lactonase [Brucella intermedia]NKC29079.1 3-oxoadipate enol-lactonase [Brucella ciceri]